MTLWIILLAAAAIIALVLWAAVRYLYTFAMARQPELDTDWWTADPADLPDVNHQYGPEQFHEYMWQMKHWLLAAYTDRGHFFETVSTDGLRLTAHYIPPEGKMRGIFLMVHGFRSCGFHDFCGAVHDITKFGFGCMVIDQRAHCMSEGDTVCFGAKERYDIISWAQLIEKEFPGMPVILDGISMGAATVMAAAALDLTANVRGIIADCGYTSMRAIFNKVITQRFHLPPFPLVPLANIYCRMKNGFDFDTVQSAQTLPQAKVPVLLAHGMKDGLVPYSMGEEIYAAAKDKIDIEFVTSPEAEHGLSYLHDYELYIAAMNRLFDKALTDKENPQ
ncbi:MAG: alpha/beta hydrolase [Ruminococcaceae bacterium]|nr:alpha/beta hydrolase [Oscillospiraceae bacterium]